MGVQLRGDNIPTHLFLESAANSKEVDIHTVCFPVRVLSALVNTNRIDGMSMKFRGS